MVKKIVNKEKVYFQCEICKMFYKIFELAEKCETHCIVKHACSMEITKHAVNLE